MNRDRQIIVAIAIIFVTILVIAAFYSLENHNASGDKPINASPEKIVLTTADLPPGWMVESTKWYSCHNTTGYGGQGWDWSVASRYVNNSGGDTWNLWILVYSLNSSGLAHDEYIGWSNGVESVPIIEYKLGDEGFMFTVFGTSNNADSVNYNFREGNIVVAITIDMDGENLNSVEPWMDQIAILQASKLHQNNPS